MKTTSKRKNIIAISLCLLAGLSNAYAGDFKITADDTVITSTNTGQISNNATIGYDNDITNSNNSFVYGGTNSVANASNATVVGGNNDVSSPSSLDTAYVFGNSNNVGLHGGGNVYLFGAGNTISNAAGNGTRNVNLSDAYAIGRNNAISNIGHMNDVYAVGVNNNIRGTRNTGGVSDVSNVFAFGVGNDLANRPSWGASTLTDAYAFGGGNMMSSAGIFKNVFQFGSNNKIENVSNFNEGNITGGYVLGERNVIYVPGGSDMANVYALGSGNTMGSGYILAASSTMNNVYALGSLNYVLSSNAVIIGNNNTVTHDDTFIFGNSVVSTNANGVILGNNSADGITNAVAAIGIGSTAPVAVAGAAPAGIVSVGAAGKERQIINVAAGRVSANSTDAINGSELYVTNTTLAALSETVATLSSGSATDALLWNSANNGFVATHGGTNSKITGVLAGAVAANSSDAINGAQLHETASSIINILGTGTVASDGTITGGTFTTGGTTVNQALTNLYNIYNSATVSVDDALMWSSTLNAYDAAHGTGSAQRITNVANGAINATSLDAINGRQLYDTATSIVNILGTGTVNADGIITGGTFATGGTTVNQALTNLYNTYNSSTAFAANALSWSNALNAYDASHGTGIAQRITNVANGAINATSFDAINGRQLYGTATSIVNILGTGTVNTDGTITGGQFIITGGTFTNISSALTNLSQTVNNIYSGSTGLVRQDATTGNITIGAATSGTIVNIAGATGDRQLSGVAAGIADNDAVNIAQLKASGIMSGTGNAIADVVVYDSGAAKTTITLGGPSVTGTGASMAGGTRITNLALAAITAASTDAVTGSQLFDTNQRVTNLETAIAVIVNATAAPFANPHFTTGGDDINIPASATGGNAVAAGMGATASGASSSAVGMGAKATATKSIAIGALAESHAASGIALGNNAVVVAAATNAVAIGANSIATEPDTVSFGSENSRRRLVNVADGINPYDAVNMRQLAALEVSITGRVDNLQTQVNSVSDRLDRVGAMAAAINQVQTNLIPDGNRNQLAMGIGIHRGHGAFAMGYSHINRLRDCGVRASFSMSDRADLMAGAGAIFAW